jgi:hypothetical protein
MVKRHGHDDLVDVEDLRQGCVAHDHWMASNLDAVAFANTWADQNHGVVTRR